MADAELTDERKRILQTRRTVRKAKKSKAKQLKLAKQQARREKKAEIVARVRAKREEAQTAAGHGNEGGCWLCGDTTHVKQSCPNRAAGDLNRTCFQCRRRGHTAHNCPQKSFGTSSDGHGMGSSAQLPHQAAVCFNCGAPDHALRNCPKPMENGGAAFATCFVCGQQGHLSSKCPKNTMGVYPKGGCCKLCKSVDHLVRDCPVGRISATSNKGGQQLANTKITFTDDDEDGGTQDGAEATGDALDSGPIRGMEQNDEGDSDSHTKKREVCRTSSRGQNPKRVKF
ncbi:unnamed protein product [Hyaloperonospora brassicae]|uniref:CCHC-type domain-containing protein n=1 Tax=Hyaloperonospora brassicae TaxID=162125 RepID=A0AAV0UKT3_HYABA|nr:unnamed protein product [Hyaloperonospora brassicae]